MLSKSRVGLAGIAVAGLVLGGGPFATAVVPEETSPLAAAFERALGYAPAMVTMTVPDGQGLLKGDVDWAKASGILARFGQPGADGPMPAERCDELRTYCGPDLSLSPLNQGPFCDGIGGWVAFEGPLNATSVVAMEPNGSTSFCSGIGTGVDYIALSPLAVQAQGGSILYEGCYATIWLIHSNGYCPNPFMAHDTFLVNWRFKGPGAFFRFEAGNVTLEAVMAQTGVSCYDLPPLVAGAGVLCP